MEIMASSKTSAISGRIYHLLKGLNLSKCQAVKHRYFSSGEGTSQLVIVEKLQNITTIGINRPHKKNCVNNATARALMEAFKKFEEDPESPVAVLYGKGGTFCAGYDLKETAESGTENKTFETENFDPTNKTGCGPMGPSRRFFKKPVIAAVSGHAVAGGLELALMCDQRIVEETAIMGVFCRRFGVPLIDGGTVRLPALIGLSRAMDLILTGRAVTGKEALEIGLANRVVACGTSLGQAIMYAQSIAKFPQECMLQDRQSAYYAAYSAKDFQDAIEYEMKTGLEIIEKESIVGAKRFVEGVGRHGSFNLFRKQFETSKL